MYEGTLYVFLFGGFMSKFINFFIKLLLYIISFLFTCLIVLIICTTIFSRKNNVSVPDTLVEFQAIGQEFLDYTLTNKVSINLSVDDNLEYSEDLDFNLTGKYRYYYEQLDSNSKIIYTTLVNEMDNLKKDNYTISFSTKFNDLLNEPNGQAVLNKAFQSALDAFTYDYPELFYLDVSKISLIIKSTSIGPITTYKVSLSPIDKKNYLNDNFKSETEVDIAISQLENIRNNAVDSLDDLSDYDKLLSVHDSLVNNLEYDITLNKPNTHNIYGALVEKNVVCEGYAKAFKYILDSLDIKNILVSGDATSSTNETESHMWNYVQLNGNWYGVDVTWDDPIIIGSSNKNSLRHTYFLKGYSTFNKSHVATGLISDKGIAFTLPTLSKTNYNK